MSINPNQGSDPNQSAPYGGYGGYGGYTPPAPQPAYDPNDPYGAYSSSQQGSSQQQQQSGSSQQQQQQYYQPPLSAQQRAQGTGGANDATSLGLSARIEALLAYLFSWFGGLVFLVLERKNHFVRFSAAQSLVLFGPTFVVYLLLRLIGGIGFISLLLGPIIGLLTTIIFWGTTILWIYLMVQTYRGRQVRLPIVADYADRVLAGFSRRGKGTV
jgi:uncharacterized membrane protein